MSLYYTLLYFTLLYFISQLNISLITYFETTYSLLRINLNLLAGWTETGSPAPYLGFRNQRAASLASLAIPAINKEIVLMAALASIAITIITESRAAICNAVRYNPVYSLMQPLYFITCQ